MLFKRDNEIISAEMIDGKVIATVMIDNRWVSNPTYASLLEAGFENYVPPEEPPYVPTYKEKIVELIRERYDMDDELAILRQRDEKPEEFAEYNAFVEECKEQAKEFLNNNNNTEE